MKMLRKAREAAGLSIKELSNLVGVSQDAISQYELGKRRPCLDILVSISDILGCSIEYLYRGSQDRDSTPRATGSLLSATPDTLADECIKILQQRYPELQLRYLPEEKTAEPQAQSKQQE